MGSLSRDFGQQRKQAGHLLMSYYFHSIMVIRGHQMDIVKQIPLQEYNLLFTSGSPEAVIGKTQARTLQNQLRLVEKRSLEIIQSLSEEDLGSPLEPTKVPHPIATTKGEALDWNIKHTMWHCGQLAMIKRTVDTRFDFGLKQE